MQNETHTPQDFHIDKLTSSIENVVTGDSFPTDIILIATSDLKSINPKHGWRFNWQIEFNRKERDVYKLTIVNNASIIQGLISIQVKEDHVIVHLIEGAPFKSYYQIKDFNVCVEICCHSRGIEVFPQW